MLFGFVVGFVVRRKSNTRNLSPKSKAYLPGVSRHWFTKTLRSQIAAELKDSLRIDKTADARQHHICWNALTIEAEEEVDFENQSDAMQKSESQTSKGKKAKKRNYSASPATYPNKKTNSQSTRYPVGISVCATIVLG